MGLFLIDKSCIDTKVSRLIIWPILFPLNFESFCLVTLFLVELFTFNLWV